MLRLQRRQRAHRASLPRSAADHQQLLRDIDTLGRFLDAAALPGLGARREGRLNFVNAAYARAVEARDGADAVDAQSRIARPRRARGSDPRTRGRQTRSRRACRWSSPARGAFSTWSTRRRGAAAPASASTPPRSRPSAPKSRAWSTRIAARSTSSRPPSRSFRRRPAARFYNAAYRALFGISTRLPRSGADRLRRARPAARRAQTPRAGRISATGKASCTKPTARSSRASTYGICRTDARCASSPRPIPKAASPICSTT